MQKMNKKISKPVSKIVRVWLFIGLVMIFFQVVIGGVTRLTDSGLSITEWSVIQGTLPPLNTGEWNIAFDKYKIHAKKQFESLHGDMTLSEFKFIFFWEYFHRLWARLMGFVFIIPFFLFLFKGLLPKWLVRRLGVVIFLAATVAVFGWLMVASGLNDDKRTWVSAYKLITHLGLAAALFCYLFWTWLKTKQVDNFVDNHRLHRIGWGIALLLMIQILFGGLMAGMRAGLIHPYWPGFINGTNLTSAIAQGANEINGISDYEASVSVKAWVQILHRFTAYLLTGFILWFYTLIKRTKSASLKFGGNLLISLLITQFVLGILTIVNAVGSIPIGYGALHQCVSLLLFASLLYCIYQFKPGYQQSIE